MTVVISILDILQDLCAIICGIMLLRTVGDYRERSRLTTVLTFCGSLAFSVVTSRMLYATYAQLFGIDPSAAVAFDDFTTIADFVTVLVEMVIWIGAPLIILRVPQKGKSALLLFALISVAELPEGILGLCLKDITVNEFLLNVINGLLIIVFYAVISALLFVYSKKSNHLLIKNVVDIAPAWLYILMFVLSMFTYFVEDLEVIFIRNIFIVLALVGVMYTMIWFFRRIGMMTAKQSEIMNRFTEQQTGYEKMLKSDQQLREFRHDYKNHMLVVTALLNAGKTDEASDYLDKIKIQSGIVGRQFSTGNFVVDAILNNKNSLAEEFEIKMNFRGLIPAEGIENSDICTVVSNLVDNAIEGIKALRGNRYINIEASVRNGNLAISVVNPVEKKIEIKNNKIKTTKSDSENHGIGLKNVRRTAEKYGGMMLLSCTDTEFTADVSMKLEKH